MSATHHLVCVTCKKHHWIGQGWSPFYTYAAYHDEKGQRHLDRFLEEHYGASHTLHVVECGDWRDFGENFEEVEYPDIDPKTKKPTELEMSRRRRRAAQGKA